DGTYVGFWNENFTIFVGRYVPPVVPYMRSAIAARQPENQNHPMEETGPKTYEEILRQETALNRAGRGKLGRMECRR
ncbi:MAG: hypothetical protein WAN65_00990, partial [Candidatus Sulfotelmatobacter sp.]